MNLREYYQADSIENYYKNVGIGYINYHHQDIKSSLEIIKKSLHGNILDLCCGTGLVTSCLDDFSVSGCDPYLHEQYKFYTGKECLKYSFKDIINGKLDGWYDIIICSFALHLCEKSMLPNLLFQLSRITNKLIIISPSDALEIKDYFTLISHHKVNRVHTRIYITKETRGLCE